MPKFTVKARAPTPCKDCGGLPPCVNMAYRNAFQIPVFHVSFPDLSPNDLSELSVYITALAYVSKKLSYPHHLSNFLSAFANAMKAASKNM